MEIPLFVSKTDARELCMSHLCGSPQRDCGLEERRLSLGSERSFSVLYKVLSLGLGDLFLYYMFCSTSPHPLKETVAKEITLSAALVFARSLLSLGFQETLR